MKILIASDIHGSSYYCKKLLDYYNESGAQRLLLLGDILYHGPRNALPRDYDPQAVVKMLNDIKHDIICIKGNCEADVDGMLLDFEINTNAHILLNDTVIHAEHGHIHGEHNPPRLKKGDILLNGHTHIPAFNKKGVFLYVNPGSVSIPKDNSPHSCIITDGKNFDFINIENKTVYKKC